MDIHDLEVVKINPCGTGLVIGEAKLENTLEASAKDRPEAILFMIWVDAERGLLLQTTVDRETGWNPMEIIKVPVEQSGTFYRFVFQYVDDIYRVVVYREGVSIAEWQSGRTKRQPTTLWLGNPVVESTTCRWTSLRLGSILVDRLK